MFMLLDCGARTRVKGARFVARTRSRDPSLKQFPAERFVASLCEGVRSPNRVVENTSKLGSDRPDALQGAWQCLFALSMFCLIAIRS